VTSHLYVYTYSVVDAGRIVLVCDAVFIGGNVLRFGGAY
jgi:hypothetical protein